MEHIVAALISTTGIVLAAVITVRGKQTRKRAKKKHRPPKAHPAASDHHTTA